MLIAAEALAASRCCVECVHMCAVSYRYCTHSCHAQLLQTLLSAEAGQMQLCVLGRGRDARSTTDVLALSWCCVESVSCVMSLLHTQLPYTTSADSLEFAEVRVT